MLEFIIKSIKTATAELAHIIHITAHIADTDVFILLFFLILSIMVYILTLIDNKVNGDL